MKYFLSTLLKIILRLPSPSLGRVPRFRDLNKRKVNKEIAIRAHQGLQEGMAQVEPLILEEENKKVNNHFDPKNMFCFLFHDFCDNCEEMIVEQNTVVFYSMTKKEVIHELTCKNYDKCGAMYKKISNRLNENREREN